MALGAIPVLGLGLLSGGAAVSAAGFLGSEATPQEIATRQQTMFDKQASLLGISVDKVKDAWAAGKTLQELAAENGITEAQLQEKLVAERTAAMKAQIQALVDQGIVTQAQADQRLAYMAANPGKAKGMMGPGGRGRGHHGMMGGDEL